MCDENVTLVQKAHEILCQKATELLLFVASDSDRQFNKDIPSCIPIAYGLKGKSLHIETARNMINVVQNALNAKNIKVLAESLDGQWAPIVFRDSDNNPLTVYEFNKDCWSRFVKMGKSTLLKYMESFAHISGKNIEGLAKPECFDIGWYRNGNIGFDVSFKLNERKENVMFLKCYSFCGDLNIPEGLRSLQTPKMSSRSNLWGFQIAISGNFLHILGFKQIADNLPEDFSEIQTVYIDDATRNLRHDLIEVNFEEDFNEDSQLSLVNFLEDSTLTECEKIRTLLLTTHRDIMERILIILMCLNNEKWKSYDIEDLYNEHMTSTNIIFKTFLSKELGEIINFLQMLAPKNFKFPKCNNKIEKANVLGYIMGHLDRVQLKRPKMKSMKTLREIWWDEITINVPINVLRVASAEWMFKMCFPKWLCKSPVPIQYEVPCDYDEYNIFAYPEKNVARNKIEPRLIDPSHCLTNMRVHATTKCIFNCNCEAFKAVSKYNNDILSAGLVHQPLLDKQSVAFAEQVFSKNVSDARTTLGYHNEAKLVTYVCNWFHACNK